MSSVPQIRPRPRFPGFLAPRTLRGWPGQGLAVTHIWVYCGAIFSFQSFFFNSPFLRICCVRHSSSAYAWHGRDLPFISRRGLRSDYCPETDTKYSGLTSSRRSPTKLKLTLLLHLNTQCHLPHTMKSTRVYCRVLSDLVGNGTLPTLDIDC